MEDLRRLTRIELETAGAGQDVIDGQRMETAITAEEYRLFGGNPDEVPAGHVRARVSTAMPGVMIGCIPVPLDAARKAGGRRAADQGACRTATPEYLPGRPGGRCP